MAAFQALGPFISTFADPSTSGIQLMYNADGTVQVASVIPVDDDVNSNKYSNANSNPGPASNKQGPAEHTVINERSNSSLSTKDDTNKAKKEQGTESEKKNSGSKKKTTHKGVGELKFNIEGGQQPAHDDSPEYSSFLYWRNPPDNVNDVNKESDDQKVESKDEGSKDTDDTNKGETIEMESLECAEDGKKEIDSRTNDDRFTSTTVFTISGEGNHGEKSSPDSGISSPVAMPDDGGNPKVGSAIKDLTQSLAEVSLEDEESPESAADGEAADKGVKLHTADVSEANDITETVMHLPSTQILEQRIGDRNMSFINGVPEEEEGPDWQGVDAPSPEQMQQALRTGVSYCSPIHVFL